MLRIGLVSSMVFNKPKFSNDHKQTVASWLDVTSTSLDMLMTAPVTGPRWWLIFFTYSTCACIEGKYYYFPYAKIFRTHRWHCWRVGERAEDGKGKSREWFRFGCVRLFSTLQIYMRLADLVDKEPFARTHSLHFIQIQFYGEMVFTVHKYARRTRIRMLSAYQIPNICSTFT